jgi:hypothetical protein
MPQFMRPKPQFMPHSGNSCPQSGQFITGCTDHRGAPGDLKRGRFATAPKNRYSIRL